jgi:putative acetyltransferase
VITVRRACIDDSDAIWRVFQDTEAYSGTLQLPFPSREVWRKRIAEPPESDFILVAEADGAIVGQAGLHRVAMSPRRAHAMSIGIAVRSDWHGKGVGRALMQDLLDLADTWLPVTRLELNVFTDNERAIRLYREFGFEIEGTHRAYALRDGRYVDSHAMARIRPK